VRLTIDRRREDAQLGGGAKNYVRKVVSFRLKGIPSGPPEGRWERDEEAIALEKKITLEAARKGTRIDLAKGIDLSGERTDGNAKGAWRLVVKGRAIRVESTGKDGRTIVCSDGTTRWRAKADGTVEDWPQVEADIVEGNAVALAAVLRDGGEADLTECAFTGGDAIRGERVSRIETRDKLGRRRKLYFSVTTGALAAIAYPLDSEKWVEEQWSYGPNGVAKLVRVDWERGDALGEDSVSTAQGVDDASVFKRPGGQ
jgi:hypothetical protein